MKRKTPLMGVLIAIVSLFVLIGGLIVLGPIAEADTEEIPAFTIGDVPYYDLKTAIESSTDGDTIVLVQDITIDASDNGSSAFPYTTVSGKTITIDLNGKTITYNSKVDSPSRYFLTTNNGAYLTITDGSLNGSGKIHADSMFIGLFGALGDSRLVIEGGTFILDSITSESGTGMLTVQGATTIEDDSLVKGLWVKGGSYTLGNVGTMANGSPWIFNAAGDNNKYEAIITGGSFNADVRNQYWVFEAEVPKEYALTYDYEEMMWTVSEAVCYVNTQHKSTNWYDYPYGCESFEVALEKIGKSDTDGTVHGDTITMLDNCCISDLDLTNEMEFTLDSLGVLYILEDQNLPEKISYVTGSSALCSGTGNDGKPHVFSHGRSCYPDGTCIHCNKNLEPTTDHTRPYPGKTCMVQTCGCGAEIPATTSHIPPEVCKDGPCTVCGTYVDTNDEHTLSNRACADRTCSVCCMTVPGNGNHRPNDVACKVSACEVCGTSLSKVDHEVPYDCKASECSICHETITATSGHDLPSTATCIDRTCGDCGTVVKASASHDYRTSGYQKVCGMCGDTINLPMEDDDDDDDWYLQWLAQQQAKAEAERIAKEMAEKEREEEQKKVAAVALATGVAVLMALLLMSVVKRN